MKITVPAARVRQGDLCLYTTSLTVKQLIEKDFYSIDRLDHEQGKGYQRLLQDNRANRLAKYISEGQDSGDVFLPTSVFLATEADIPFNADNNTITFDTNDIKGSDGKKGFNVVDGQHRIEGLRRAADNDPRVLNFEVPVNIAYKLPFLHQMCHFLIVNTTQKSVDKGIEQQIISRLTENKDIEAGPRLPKWIQTIVDREEIDKAYKLVRYLNDTSGSPWEGKILMAGQVAKKFPNTTTNQASFVSLIDKYIMTANHPLRLTVEDPEKQRKIITNYWIAISNLLEPDPELEDAAKTNLYQYAGTLIFSMFSMPFFYKITSANEGYTVKTMEKYLKKCFENITGEYELLGTPTWWMPNIGHATAINAGVATKISSAMTVALNKSDGDIIV